MSTNKSKPIFGLNKIPDNELLQQARVEIGKLNSYIMELEHNIAKLQHENARLNKLSSKERKSVQREIYGKNLETEREWRIKDLETALKKQQKAYDALLNKYLLFKQKVET
jgi:predicted RNase H-like nuclease (RuvC/YqgF family)